jgi:hypothetical protein
MAMAGVGLASAIAVFLLGGMITFQACDPIS